MSGVTTSLLAAALTSPGPALTPAGTSTPPDIRGIVPPQPYYLAASPWLLVIAVVCVALAAVVAWYVFSRPRAPQPPPPPIPPRELAERRLRELAARAGSLDARAFGNEVTDVLRAYIGAQFSLRPERQTSQEFLASVSGSRAFTRAEHELLTHFLEGCDLLKFARAEATPAGKEALLAQAGDFVRSSAPPPLPAGLPPAAEPALR